MRPRVAAPGRRACAGLSPRLHTSTPVAAPAATAPVTAGAPDDAEIAPPPADAAAVAAVAISSPSVLNLTTELAIAMSKGAAIASQLLVEARVRRKLNPTYP